MFRRIALFTFCIMRHDSAKRRILGVAHTGGGLRPPNSNSAEIFVQYTYSPSFIILCVLMLTHKPTNKQMPLKTCNVLGYATTLGT